MFNEWLQRMDGYIIKKDIYIILIINTRPCRIKSQQRADYFLYKK